MVVLIKILKSGKKIQAIKNTKLLKISSFKILHY